MENFTAFNPVRLHFGRDVVNHLGKTVKQFGNKVLLTYGQGSVKKYGYYDKVITQLKAAGLEVSEYSGIKPNPVVEDVEKAVALGRKHQVEVIVALGGGSVVDSSKVIALSIASGLDPWEIMTYAVNPEKTIPLVNVLTLAATGTEMNAAAVVQNRKTGQKLGFVHPLNFPKEAFLDPQFTATVPANYTAYGIVDLIAHALEAYFGEGEPSVIDSITFAIIKDAIQWGPELMKDLGNYELRANIMLDATLALNGLTMYGKKSGDWGVHGMGHELSLLYDTAHGATLSIAYPAWMKLKKEKLSVRIRKLGRGVFGVNTAEETIEAFTAFFSSIQSPVTLTEIGLDKSNSREIIAQFNKNGVSGMCHKLSNDDYARLVDLML
ncbi:MAG: iron-containing alcohol dehydrogenase [Bacteroidales bacterium]|nr:iron-containing alcohol dehydrogenase [Bacteroidales bacterium]